VEAKVTTCDDAVKEAVANLGAEVSKKSVIEYIHKKYPGKWKDGSITGSLIGLSNHPSAKHHPSTHKKAFLIYHGNGKYTVEN